MVAGTFRTTLPSAAFRPMRSLLCLALLAAFFPLPAPAGEVALWRMKIAVDGIPFGEMTVRERRRGARYEVQVQGRASELIGFFLRARYRGVSTGRGRGGAARPRLFAYDMHRIFRQRQVRIAYAGGRPVRVAISPRSDRSPLSTPDAVLRARPDPLVVLAELFHPRTRCPEAAEMYDGRRIARIAFAPPETTSDGFLCRGSYVILRGPDHSLRPGQRVFPLTLRYRAPPGGAGTLARIELRSGRDMVTLTPEAAP